MGTVLKDTPIMEITLRKYEKPYNLSDREIVKKLCLSLGLLQPGDSRDIIVDIFYVLLQERKKNSRHAMLSSKAIEDKVIIMRKKRKLPLKGVASSNVRRQLKRLRNLYIIEKVKTAYRITEQLPLEEIMDEKIEKFIINTIVPRIRDYAHEVDSIFQKRKNSNI